MNTFDKDIEQTEKLLEGKSYEYVIAFLRNLQKRFEGNYILVKKGAETN